MEIKDMSGLMDGSISCSAWIHYQKGIHGEYVDAVNCPLVGYPQVDAHPGLSIACSPFSLWQCARDYWVLGCHEMPGFRPPAYRIGLALDFESTLSSNTGCGGTDSSDFRSTYGQSHALAPSQVTVAVPAEEGFLALGLWCIQLSPRQVVRRMGLVRGCQQRASANWVAPCGMLYWNI